MENSFAEGQRWVSEPEPTLGIGIVKKSAYRNVTVYFSVSEESRVYRIQNAPLKRVQYRSGDEIGDSEGNLYTVTEVYAEGNLFRYKCGNKIIPEEELTGRRIFNKPEDKLFSDQPTHVRDFELRLNSLKYRHSCLTSSFRGLIGSRIDLLKHQIYIAHSVSAQAIPRVLLADEVGLGKTIEAGLIFHNLFVTGKANRTLVLTPPALVNQWLVELYRKFNYMFSIVDKDTYKETETGSEKDNPFLENQNVICPIDYLISSEVCLNDARKAGWDLLIVDEAHHLQWSEESVSPEYKSVETLLKSIKGLLLLTATPLQLGETSHFGRLKLLDPKRYQSFSKYKEESKGYNRIVELARDILKPLENSSEIQARIKNMFPRDEGLQNMAENLAVNGTESRQKITQALIDRHGTGRMVFRNKRSAIKGFPTRELKPIKLEPTNEFSGTEKQLYRFLNWNKSIFELDTYSLTPANLKLPQSESAEIIKKLWITDPRIHWLVDFLKKLKPGEKALLICSSTSKVQSLQSTLPLLTNIPFTTFHEDLPLNIRDKKAADFSKKAGVRLLISSEIGSEGRNFQFSHKLILFDLPLNPELLEQRIGRLHRIGQKKTVQIYVPYIVHRPAEILFHWYHGGLDAFATPLSGSEKIFQEFHEPLNKLAEQLMESDINFNSITHDLNALTSKTVKEKENLLTLLEEGRNRLLELNSLQSQVADSIISQIIAQDESVDLEGFMEDVFEGFGIHFTPTVEKRGYQVFPGSEMILDAFPGLSESGMNITFDRETALIREDMTFLSWDHPIVTGALDLILGSTENISCICEWHSAPLQTVLLEAVFVLEPLEDPRFHLSSYLPPTPVRVLVDGKGTCQEHYPELEKTNLRKGSLTSLGDKKIFKETLMPKMLLAAWNFAKEETRTIKIKSAAILEARLKPELNRLQNLQKNNAFVKPEDIAFIHEELESTRELIENAELRMDSVRIIILHKK